MEISEMNHGMWDIVYEYPVGSLFVIVSGILAVERILVASFTGKESKNQITS